MSRWFTLLSLGIIIVSSIAACDWMEDIDEKASQKLEAAEEKIDAAVERVEEEVLEHVVVPIVKPFAEGAMEVFFEIMTFDEDTPQDGSPPPPCAGPSSIIPILPNHSKLNNYGKYLVSITPDSLLPHIDKSYFIYTSQDRMPLYFPYYLDYSETLGYFRMRMNYCDYSRMHSYNYSVKVGEIDQIQVHNNWVALRSYDDDASFMSAEKYDIRYYLIDMANNRRHNYLSEDELREGCRSMANFELKLLWYNEFVDWYVNGDHPS